MISLIEGTELVRLARMAVEKYLQESIIIKSERNTSEKAGVFVTVNYVTASRKEYLRGCIGFPLPENPLYQGVIEAAVAAATGGGAGAAGGVGRAAGGPGRALLAIGGHPGGVDEEPADERREQPDEKGRYPGVGRVPAPP